MTEIVWITLTIGSIIFGFGLTSGIMSARVRRANRESEARIEKVLHERVKSVTATKSAEAKSNSGTTGMNMAAGGAGNGSPEFEAASHSFS